MFVYISRLVSVSFSFSISVLPHICFAFVIAFVFTRFTKCTRSQPFALTNSKKRTLLSRLPRPLLLMNFISVCDRYENIFIYALNVTHRYLLFFRFEWVQPMREKNERNKTKSVYPYIVRMYFEHVSAMKQAMMIHRSSAALAVVVVVVAAAAVLLMRSHQTNKMHI